MFTLPGKAIKNLFSPPSPPPVPELPPLPDRSDKQIAQDKGDEKRRRAGQKGFGESILTTGLGVTESPNVKKPKLLGGVGNA